MQSALTGESLPVTKGPGDGVYSGSTCKQGEIEAIVIATGVHTFFGKAAHLVDSTNQVGHFQKARIYIMILFRFFGIAPSVVMLDAEMFCYYVGLNCNRELLYLFYRCWNVSRNRCHVSHSTPPISPWNRQFACPSHWRNSYCYAYCSICDNGNRFTSPCTAGWFLPSWDVRIDCLLHFPVDQFTILKCSAGCHYKTNDCNRRDGWHGCSLQ